ncbi:MAG: hypothetical protein EZS28_017269, partial [Streblomastix strix]
DETLLLLKADKTQLIDSFTKGETNNLLNNKADTGVSYTKGEDDALLLLKADKQTTYTKTESDQLISQIDTGSSYTITAKKTFNKTCRFVNSIDGMSTVIGSSFIKSGADNTVVLLGVCGIKTIAEFGRSDYDSNYVKQTGQLSQIITEKLINTDITESFDNLESRQYATKYDIEGAFVKKTGQNLQVIEGYLRKGNEAGDVSEDVEDYITRGFAEGNYVTNNSAAAQKILGVLLANGTTKLLSEFTGTPTDLSNYYTKTQTYSQTEANNIFVRLEGSIQQTITERLKYVSPFGGTYDETQDAVENTYLTQSKVDAKLINYVNTTNNQSINGTKILNANVNATGFVKTGKDDTSVLLPDGGDRLLSSFDGIEDLTLFAFSRNDVGHNQNIMVYISEKGFYLGVSIGSVDQDTSLKGNTQIAIAGVYYTDYESLMRATSYLYGDGKINIVDDWHIHSTIDRMKSMFWVQNVVQKQTEAIGDIFQPYDPMNNKTFVPHRSAYFVKEGLICMIQIDGNDTPDVVVNQGLGYYPMN